MGNGTRWTEADLAKHQGKAAPKVKKKNKYGATRVPDPENPGVTIDSKREAKHLRQMRALLRADEFDFLATQIEFRLEGGKYVADFLTGKQQSDGSFELTVYDSKGMKTPVYNRSKKQMKERYGVDIIEL